MNIQVVTDSTCDLPKALSEQNKIHIIPLYINMGDQGYIDGIDLTRQEFYQRLPNQIPPPTTATPSIDTFLNVYKDLIEQGANHIFSIHISEKLSATVNVARRAAEQIKSLPLKVPVTVIDSQQISMGTGFVVLKAVELVSEGLGSTEILECLEAFHPRVFVFAALDTLEYLRRSGRMNNVIAGIGSLLQVKPLLKMHQGEPMSEKVRTKSRSIQRLINLVQEVGALEKIALVHTNAPNTADELWKKVKPLFPNFDKPISVNVTPVIGTHLGPNAVGFALIQAAKT